MVTQLSICKKHLYDSYLHGHAGTSFTSLLFSGGMLVFCFSLYKLSNAYLKELYYSKLFYFRSLYVLRFYVPDNACLKYKKKWLNLQKKKKLRIPLQMYTFFIPRLDKCI